ncbi:diguanylate cyclase domain-containing protein [Terrarubrum flagellatum]|uniref:diguanylate cyclase domain-containing protein n=1 Tax=Terrirubrum flagellatum TaxID=2895980 RepID=UPI003144EA12
MRLATLVFLLASFLMALSSASLLYVGRIASKEADAQAAANETRLLHNALRDRQILMAREQLTLARWTKSYKNIVENFRKSYIKKEFADWLWSDYGHQAVFLVAAGGDRLLLAAREEKIDFAPPPLASNDPVREITRRAVTRYMAGRETLKDGFAQKRAPATKVDEIAEFGYAVIDGEPAMLSAMAIVPDDDEGIAMPDGPPVFLVSAKFLRHDFGRELNMQLGFRNFSFKSGVGGASELMSLDGSRLGGFVWESDRPGAKIWSVIVPLILLLVATLGLVAILAARVVAKISTRLEASEARNRRLALHDALTGLANRLQFTQALEAAAARCEQAPFALIACDLDRFKAVNDTYGHAGGDAVIRTVATRLAKLLGDGGLVGRTGGDEFVILATAFVDRPRLTLLCHQIIADICEPITLDDGATTDVGVSLGVAVAPDQGHTPEAIMAQADAALYLAKDRGRGVAAFAHELPAAPENKKADALANSHAA